MGSSWELKSRQARFYSRSLCEASNRFPFPIVILADSADTSHIMTASWADNSSEGEENFKSLECMYLILISKTSRILDDLRNMKEVKTRTLNLSQRKQADTCLCGGGERDVMNKQSMDEHNELLRPGSGKAMFHFLLQIRKMGAIRQLCGKRLFFNITRKLLTKRLCSSSRASRPVVDRTLLWRPQNTEKTITHLTVRLRPYPYTIFQNIFSDDHSSLVAINPSHCLAFMVFLKLLLHNKTNYEHSIHSDLKPIQIAVFVHRKCEEHSPAHDCRPLVDAFRCSDSDRWQSRSSVVESKGSVVVSTSQQTESAEADLQWSHYWQIRLEALVVNDDAEENQVLRSHSRMQRL